MKRSMLLIPLLLIGCGGSQPQQVVCVNDQGTQVQCPARREQTPEEQTRSKYVTTVEGCKIYFITTPKGYANLYLSKCDDGSSAVQHTLNLGKYTQKVTNLTSNVPEVQHLTTQEQAVTPSLTNLVETEQRLKQVIGQLTLEDRKLLLESANAVHNLEH